VPERSAMYGAINVCTNSPYNKICSRPEIHSAVINLLFKQTSYAVIVAVGGV